MEMNMCRASTLVLCCFLREDEVLAASRGPEQTGSALSFSQRVSPASRASRKAGSAQRLLHHCDMWVRYTNKVHHEEGKKHIPNKRSPKGAEELLGGEVVLQRRHVGTRLLARQH